MRRWMTVMLSFLLFVPSLKTSVYAEEKSQLEKVNFNIHIESDDSFERPFAGTLQTLNTAFGVMDGAQVSYTVATGADALPAIFNVVNLETGELMYYESMPNATKAWSLVTDSVGNVYIGASGSPAQLWKFNPQTKELDKIGEPIDGMIDIFALTTDGTKIYGGGYPTGKAFEYNPETDELKDLGVIDSGVREEGIKDVQPEPYIRSAAYADGYVFFGTGNQNGRIIKMDVKSGGYEKELISMPVNTGTTDYFSNMGLTYDLRVVDKYLFAFFNGPFDVLIYDLENEHWLDQKIENVRGLVGTSREYLDYVYLSSKDKNMYRFNLKTLELDPEPYYPFDANLRNTEVLNIDGRNQMVSIHFNGSYYFMDFTGDEPIIINKPSPAIGQSINIQSLHIDDATQKMFASGFMGTEIFEQDLLSGYKKKIKLGQLEGMTSDGKYVYFGEYPAASIYRYPLSGQGEVEKLFQLREYDQDRPFKLVVSQNKLFVGTIADYGKLQGALTIYDLESGDIKVYDNIAKDQGIVGIAIDGDYAYLSTTTRGGIGSKPTQKSALIIKFNWKTEEVEAIKQYDGELKGQKIPMISGLMMENDSLWAFVNGAIMEIDLDDLSVRNIRVMYDDIDNFGNWRPVHAFMHDGLIYANPGFNITIIHPKTLDSQKVGRSSVFSIDKEGSIYYLSGVDIKKLEMDVNMEEFWKEEIETETTPPIDNPVQKENKEEKEIIDPSDGYSESKDKPLNNKVDLELPATGKSNNLYVGGMITILGYILMKNRNS